MQSATTAATATAAPKQLDTVQALKWRISIQHQKHKLLRRRRMRNKHDSTTQKRQVVCVCVCGTNEHSMQRKFAATNESIEKARWINRIKTKLIRSTVHVPCRCGGISPISTCVNSLKRLIGKWNSNRVLRYVMRTKTKRSGDTSWKLSSPELSCSSFDCSYPSPSGWPSRSPWVRGRSMADFGLSLQLLFKQRNPFASSTTSFWNHNPCVGAVIVTDANVNPSWVRSKQMSDCGYAQITCLNGKKR